MRKPMSCLFRRWLSKSALAIVSATICLDAQGIVYLKADAPDGGDGASWATAYRNVEQAESAARASDNVIYAAAGIYPVTNKMAVTSGFEIYGGFPGLSETETLQDRDPKIHQTILTADWELDDIWVHVEPVPGGFRFIKTELPGETVLSNGVIRLPPSYTGDYDSYYAKCRAKGGNPACAFHLVNCERAVFDGLCFTGFRINGNDGDVINIKEKCGEIAIRDCLFIGNEPNSGQVLTASGTMTLSSCRFLFSSTTSVATAVRVNGGTAVIEDCDFEGSWRTGNASGGVIQLGGKSVEIRRCRFTRCIGVSTGNEHMWGGSGALFSGKPGALAISDSLFEDCFSASSGGIGSPLLAIHDATISRCSFLRNTYEVSPSAGRAYTMVGNATATSCRQSFDGCVFRDNVVRSTAVKLSGGAYAIAIVGNNSPGGAISVVNCTFDSNHAEAAPVDGVTAFPSRAVLGSFNSQGNEMELGIANCTFRGSATDGSQDVVQFGGSSDRPLHVVNSIFMVEDGPVADPFLLSRPELLVLHDCTIKNRGILPAGASGTGLRDETIPFVAEETAAPFSRRLLLPAVKTPGLRETADVAVNDTGAFTTYRFRPRGEEAWLPLLPLLGAVSAEEAVPLADAKGEARAFGSYTRGAVQEMTAAAETGANLFLRCEPYYGGTVSTPASQAVEAGRPIEPVTATAAGDCRFLGWYRADGSSYSEAATLEIASLTEDLELIARFETPRAAITFDLGEAGLFTETGSRSITVETGIGDLFPAVPPFTESSEWHIHGWDAFPAVVPAEGGTYRAQYVTTAVRVFHVVPEEEVPATSDGSGDSWENATADLDKAYRDAGIYRGEVWMKEGVYVRTGNLSGLANVSIIGGFAGTETSASEADPVAHPTILTGDQKGNDFWKINQKEPPVADRVPVWRDGVFSEPNPDGTEDYWWPSGNVSDNTRLFLSSGQGPLTNAVLEGLTITCFDDIFHFNSGLPDLVARRCRFLANGVYPNQDLPPIQVQEGRFRAEECEFVGNSFLCRITCITPGQCTSFENCTFRENATSGGGSALAVLRDASLLVNGCTFLRGRTAIQHEWARYSMVTNCLFTDNLLIGNPRGIIAYGGYHLGDSHGVKMVIDSRFIGNRIRMTTDNAYGGCIANWSVAVSPCVMNCYFEGNRLEVAENITKGLIATVFASSTGFERPTLLNCTMTGNRIVNSSRTFTDAGTICSRGRIVIANCLLDNQFEGPGAEFVMDASPDKTFALVNTIARNDTPSYEPFHLHGVTASIGSCAISGSDGYVQPEGQGGVVKNLSSDPGSLTSVRKGLGGALARGVAASSPYGRAGFPLWTECSKGTIVTYLYDDTGDHAEHPVWIRLDLKKDNTYPSLPAITLETPLLPDAFGAARLLGRVSYGPLNVLPGGTILFVR